MLKVEELIDTKRQKQNVIRKLQVIKDSNQSFIVNKERTDFSSPLILSFKEQKDKEELEDLINEFLTNKITEKKKEVKEIDLLFKKFESFITK